jgi:hypothetical protein
MKKKTLPEIAVKIIGLIAAWNFVTSMGTILSVLGMFAMFMNGGVQNSFMYFVSINALLTFLIPGAIAFLCLFKTEGMLRFLKLDDEETVDIKLDSYLLFHVLVLVSAVCVFINGCNHFMVYNYNTDTHNEIAAFPTSSGQFQNKTSVNNTESKNVNYLALIEIVIGVFVFLKAPQISDLLGDRYYSDEDLSESKQDS